MGPNFGARPTRGPALLAWGLALLLVCTSCSQINTAHFPEARTMDQVDDYHGTMVADPYRWLEDPETPESKAWIAARQQESRAFLDAIPEREAIEQRLAKLWNFPRWSAPSRRGHNLFFSKNDGLQNQAVVYVTSGAVSEARVLLDPNTLTADGTMALGDMKASRDGTLVAYALSTAGSDWVEWHVREVATGRDREDVLRWSKFSSASWLPDGSGFYYSRYPEPKEGQSLRGVNRNQHLCFHRLGTLQSADKVVYERTDEPDWGFSGEVTEDGRFLVIPSWVGTDSRNRVFFKHLDAPDAPVQALFTAFDASFDFLGNEGELFYFRTDHEAPRSKIVAVNLHHPEPQHWRTVVPQGAGTIADARMAGGKLAVLVMESVKHRLFLHETSGALLRELVLPGSGTVGALSTRPRDAEIYFSFTSFTTPASVWRHDVNSGDTTCWAQPPSVPDPKRFVTEQVTYTSKDGTAIPMYLVHRADVQRGANAPVLLYGYGGFNIPIMPAFSVANLAWLEMGGIYAQPALRGGSEFGEEWHQAGMLQRKQNVFDDFIGAAEWLIREGWSSAGRIAINGGSNGGLLVGACMTQRPELFGACLPAVGVMDMLRFHKFTIGWAWVPEYGSADDAAMFPVLRAYSPLHNLKAGAHYPATLVFTADHDDRVVPAHSFKFTAALQAAQGGDAPCLIRIETKAGHGAGTPTAKAIEEAADRLAFLVRIFGMSGF